MKVYKIAFYFLLIGLLITASMTSKNGFLMKTKHAKAGIVSLELTSKNNIQDSILHEWYTSSIYQLEYSRGDEVQTKKINGIETAIKQIYSDYAFIFFYVSFLCVLFWRYISKNQFNNDVTENKIWLLLCGLVVLAGVCDIVENKYLLDVLKPYHDHGQRNAIFVFIPAVIKFLLLIGCLIYYWIKVKLFKNILTWLNQISGSFKFILYLTWTFRIIIIVLFVLYALLIFSDQGQDLLVTINTSKTGTSLFFIIVSILAVLNWYLPKLYAEDLVSLSKEENTVKLDYGRLLGGMTFLIPATGILFTMQAYHIPYLAQDISPLIILLVFCLFYVNVLRHNGMDFIYKRKGVFAVPIYIVTTAMILLYIFSYGFLVTKNDTPFYLANLAIGFYLLSFAFLLTSTYRTCFKAFEHIKIKPFVIGAGLLVVLIFIIFNFEGVINVMTSFDRFFSLPIVIAALITYVLLFSYLLVLGKKKGIQFVTILLVLTFVISSSSITDFHKVSLVEGTPTTVKLRDYVRSWLEQRKDEMNKFNAETNTPYPVFFVNSYGGGIRATAWTTMVIGKLDKDLLRYNDQDFQHYVFSYSGASGGTVGLSLLCASRMGLENPSSRQIFYPDSADLVYKHDYLTGNLVGVFGRDALMSSIAQNWYADRARLQESTWEKIMANYNINYSIPISKGWLGLKMEIPLLFSNTYDINTGYKGIVAPVKLDTADFPGTVFVNNLIGKKEDIRLSTAALMSARFPYVSPTGKFDENHHFTDGGILENSGAETSYQTLLVFKSIIDSLKKTPGSGFENTNIKFNILSLPNGLAQIDSLERVTNLNEIVAPALGILNSRNGNTVKSDSINRFTAKRNQWGYFSIRPKERKINGAWPVLPLGWQISDYALLQMKATINDQQKAFDFMLAGFPKRKIKRTINKK